MAPVDLCKLVFSCIIYRKGEVGNEYLILKRSDYQPRARGLWQLLGGDILSSALSTENLQHHSKEPIEKAVREHALEQLCIHLKDISGVGSYSFISEKKVPVIGLQLASLLKEGQVFLNNLYSECRWIYAEDSSEYEFLGNAREDILSFEQRERALQNNS